VVQIARLRRRGVGINNGRKQTVLRTGIIDTRSKLKVLVLVSKGVRVRPALMFIEESRNA
jgi:L-lysine 2,3-aminomutase